MPSRLPRLPLRFEEDIKLKLEYIAFKNGRSSNKEIRNLLVRYIDQFEKTNGVINVGYYCKFHKRPIVCDNGVCFLKAKCSCDCIQCGGTGDYLTKR